MSMKMINLPKGLTLIALSGIFLSSVNGGPITLTANFDSLNSNGTLGTSYTEGGISFGSPSALCPVNGAFASILFGWGSSSFSGTALAVHNTGWVSLSAADNSLMTSVSFRYGFDWNGYLIEYGLMDVNVEWRAMSGDTLVGAGGVFFDQNYRSHGGGWLSAAVVGEAFDNLLIRSTAIGYEAIPAGPNSNWYFERGGAINYGDLNCLAFDSVTIGLAERGPVVSSLFAFAPIESVGEGGATWVLFSIALSVLLYLSRRGRTILLT